MNADEWKRIRALHSSGESTKGIARRLGMSRNTVRRALSLATAPTDGRATKGSAYDTYRDAIADVLKETPNASVQQIADRLGWTLSRTTLTNYVSRIRAEHIDAVSEHDSQTRTSRPVPAYTTTFIGRHQELARLRQLLGERRLVTITGIGGVGKSRLATHAGRELRRAFHDGVRLIELASVRSASLLPQAILDGVGIGGRDQPGRPTETSLVEFLRDRQMLIILDNCEHLTAACAELLHRLLRATTSVKVIATSRETLSVLDEFVLRLEPLPIEQPGVGAMALFADRANAVLSGFALDKDNEDAVRRICDRLDGVPLAIELACARLPVLSLDDLADRLDDRFDLLTTGNRAGPARHRSLVATIDWSYDHCTAGEQLLWSRASVFAGGFDFALIERVCTDDVLTSDKLLDCLSGLVSKSIVLREESNGVVRFRLLESLREYGQERFSPRELDLLRLRQHDWCRELLADSVDRWFSPDQVAISDRLRSHRANVRQVLDAALSATDAEGIADAAEMISGPWFLWSCGFSIRECRMWLIRVTELAADVPEQQARALATLAFIQSLQGDRDAAAQSLHRAGSLAEICADRATADFVVHTDGMNEYFAGNFERSDVLLRQAIDRYGEREPRAGLFSALLVHLGMYHILVRNLDKAAQYFQRTVDLSTGVSESWFSAYATWGLGAVALLGDRHEAATAYARQSVELFSRFDDVIGITLITDLVAWSESAAGSPERAATLLGAASQMWGSFGQELYGSTQWVSERARFETHAQKALGRTAYQRLHRAGSLMSTQEVVDYIIGDRDSPGPVESGTSITEVLTRREREVAAYLADGLANKEIADRMVLSPRTVEGHVEHILQKLCVTNRNQAAAALAAETVTRRRD